MKTFLSIGSGPGIGFATAERFAKEGFHVVLSARTAEKTKRLVDQLTAKGYSAEAKTVDAGNPASVSNLVAAVEKQHGAIEVLHYNAAFVRQATIASQPIESFNTDLAVNIGGSLAATQAVAQAMVKNGSGTVLLTGGGFALSPHPDYLSISIGKAGIRAQALALFDALKEQGIHIASVTVGTFVNPDSKEATDIGEEFWKLYSQPKSAWTAEVMYPQN
ncbi:MAG TPA: SDR family NAD(P)-dependent oxidoreductase [Methylophilus sp.]|uniref:SDR family NAD(P)-dependent oxidoreductase n=1 Tax=Methylophilus sp. TaxID=29541 RepID=UPI002B6AD25E|nr:SDR family NAD(P)-dependent oxidoreductase [Methylophilus sp.]HSH86157.1 SDR family NAD(P)-dependent oxidoreductase [Methylophilus sp.]